MGLLSPAHVHQYAPYRRAEESESGVLSSMWTEGQQSSQIVHIEPLTP